MRKSRSAFRVGVSYSATNGVSVGHEKVGRSPKLGERSYDRSPNFGYPLDIREVMIIFSARRSSHFEMGGEALRSGDSSRKLSNIVISLQGGMRSDGAIVSIQHPIKANPVKTGDAKLWVYRRENGHDCQAAEDHKVSMFVVLSLGFPRARRFSSNPKRIGNAKRSGF